MTLDEIKQENPGKRLVAMADPDNGLQLYAGTNQIEWPSDWPSTITGAFLEDNGFEVLRP